MQHFHQKRQTLFKPNLLIQLNTQNIYEQNNKRNLERPNSAFNWTDYYQAGGSTQDNAIKPNSH